MKKTFYNYNQSTERLTIETYDIIQVDQYLNESNIIERLCFDRVDIQTTWMEHGGGFLKALGEALSHADMYNAKIILENFGHYVYEYYKQGLLDLSLFPYDD